IDVVGCGQPGRDGHRRSRWQGRCRVRDAWNALRRCWTLPGADDHTRMALLERQLRSHMRITPACILASLVTAASLLLSLWAYADRHQALLWFAFFVLTHLAWMAYARIHHATLRSGELPVLRRQLRTTALLGALAA